MITSIRGEGLVLPKGGWESDETVEMAAQRECLEEAGVLGELQEEVGPFEFDSKRQASLGRGGPTVRPRPPNPAWPVSREPHVLQSQGRCIARLFLLRVREELPVWAEQSQRTRLWCSPGEGARRARWDWMRDALREFERAITPRLSLHVRPGGASGLGAGSTPLATHTPVQHGEPARPAFPVPMSPGATGEGGGGDGNGHLNGGAALQGGAAAAGHRLTATS